jgi:hypothetical protein
VHCSTRTWPRWIVKAVQIVALLCIAVRFQCIQVAVNRGALKHREAAELQLPPGKPLPTTVLTELYVAYSAFGASTQPASRLPRDDALRVHASTAFIRGPSRHKYLIRRPPLPSRARLYRAQSGPVLWPTVTVPGL